MASTSDLLARIVALEKDRDDKNRQLQLLNATVKQLDATVKQLDAALALKDNTIVLLKQNMETLQTKANRTEQYTMRPQLRLHGIPAPKENESNADVLNTVKEICGDLGVGVADDDIFRAHRVGKKYVERKEDCSSMGKQMQSIIARFRSWEKRCELYRARPRKGKPRTKKTGKNKKEKAPVYSAISLDLSKPTRDLLDKAKQKIEDKLGSDQDHCYAFADINCNLCVRVPGYVKKFAYFSNESELDKILAGM